MSTIPVPAGAVAVIWVALLTATLFAEFGPKATVAPLAKLVPVIVTLVPPASVPDDGLTPVTVGAGGGVQVLDASEVASVVAEAVAIAIVVEFVVGLITPSSWTLT